MKIVFATNNQHKLGEIRAILGERFEVLSLSDIGCDVDIPETGTTLEENSLLKAQYVYDHYHLDCFADDSGLEVDALNGAPGIYSARYASMAPEVQAADGGALSHDSDANMARLLRELGDSDNRKARFRTVITLIKKKNICPCGCTAIKEILRFEGTAEGEIIRERRGGEGFGYDPIFQPEGYDKTFAELGTEVKNRISHRAKATARLCEFLSKMMMVLLIALFASPAMAQIGTWKNYLAYSEIQDIRATQGDEIFVRASNNLYKYNRKDQSITTYDRINGLSDTHVKHIAWSQKANRLIVVYDNSNIDLLDLNGNTTNISSLYTKTMTDDKTVNNVFIDAQYAYLATNFGVVKVDIQRAEIAETYMLGHKINSVDVRGSLIYAFIVEQVSNLNSWLQDIPFSIEGTTDQVIRMNENSLLCTIRGSLNDNLIDPKNWTATYLLPAYAFERDMTEYNELLPTIQALNPGGPKYNYFGFLRYANDRLYTCGGGDNASRTPATIQVLKDGEWDIYQDEGIEEQTGVPYINMNCLDYDPFDITHVYGGSRTGVYEFKDGRFVRLYNDENSPIESFNGSAKHYELIYGLKFDSQGRLWFVNSQADTQSLIELTRDGEFISHYVPELMKLDGKSLGNLCDLRFDSKGYLWIANDHFGLASAYRYDTEEGSINTYSDFVNQDGTTITAMYGLSCTREDKDGNVWIGTDVGPFLLEKSQIEANQPVYTQVKIPRNDGTNYADYLLNKVSITDICIDQANRKWIATGGNGVYLISADNLTQLEHFTIDNSKLLSNTVTSIAINHQTGEVYFGSNFGLCSYVADATTTNDALIADNVYAYPNPVTPDYGGLITVVGLSYNSDVKVLAANGALVAEGRSNGGSFTWDGCDRKGHRVASGVYMVVSATEEGKKGVVCKIAIIN